MTTCGKLRLRRRAYRDMYNPKKYLEARRKFRNTMVHLDLDASFLRSHSAVKAAFLSRSTVQRSRRIEAYD